MKKYLLKEIAVREPLTGDAHFEIPDDAQIIGVERHENIDGWRVCYVVPNQA